MSLRYLAAFFLSASLLAMPCEAAAGELSGETDESPCLEEGAEEGQWQAVFSGFGCTRLERSPEALLRLSPKPSRSANETHAALMVGPTTEGPFILSARLETVAQLRQGTAPNPWEVGWLAWDYHDAEHFYYFIPKPNGWEIGKRDPAYPGGQRFLATGSKPRFPIAQWVSLRIAQRPDGSVQVFTNGLKLAEFNDDERPYISGRVALYCEDADVRFSLPSLKSPLFLASR